MTTLLSTSVWGWGQSRQRSSHVQRPTCFPIEPAAGVTHPWGPQVLRPRRAPDDLVQPRSLEELAVVRVHVRHQHH